MGVPSPKRKRIMKNLAFRISEAVSTEELRKVLNEEPKQENGEAKRVIRHLQDVFWYLELNTIDKKKDFCLKVCNSYSN